MGAERDILPTLMGVSGARLSRRSLLRLAAMAGGASAISGILAACGDFPHADYCRDDQFRRLNGDVLLGRRNTVVGRRDAIVQWRQHSHEHEHK